METQADPFRKDVNAGAWSQIRVYVTQVLVVQKLLKVNKRRLRPWHSWKRRLLMASALLLVLPPTRLLDWGHT